MEGIGPTAPFVVGSSTYTGRPTYVSGRVTSLALSPKCHGENCTIFVGAAGGGVWTANNALASPLELASLEQRESHLIRSAPSSLNPTDTTGKTLYVGTGEANGSSDQKRALAFTNRLTWDIRGRWCLAAPLWPPAVQSQRSPSIPSIPSTSS